MEKLLLELDWIVDNYQNIKRRLLFRKDGDIYDVFCGDVDRSGIYINRLDKQYPYTFEGLTIALKEVKNHLGINQ